MAKIDTEKLFRILNDETLVNKKAKDVDELMVEINKVPFNIKRWLSNLDVEQSIKKILWEGILNQYGTFGTKSGQVKKYKNKKKGIEYDFNQQFTKGKLLSIDFGTSNIDRELSLTHTGIVLADYTGMVIVVPMTSQTSIEYDNLAPDIQNDVIPIYKKDYSQIENDSYILMHQMRVISKNRITKKGIIGSLAGTEVMKNIELKIIKILAYSYYLEQEEKIKMLETRVKELEK